MDGIIILLLGHVKKQNQRKNDVESRPGEKDTSIPAKVRSTKGSPHPFSFSFSGRAGFPPQPRKTLPHCGGKGRWG